MKKEVFIAVLIGFGLGLIITYGLYRMRSTLLQSDSTTQTIPSVALDDAAESLSVLSLHTPEDGSIQTETTTTITGTTFPNTFAVIFVNDIDTIVTTDDTGNFTYEAQLITGTNIITAHVVSPEGESFKAERVVIVTDIFTQSPPATSSATEITTEDE